MRCLPWLSFSTLIVHSFAASADQWTSRSIYQVVTDRFAVSDNSSPTCDSGARLYCGGTWQGIINHLDYIQNMGFDAVWISPVVKNIEDTTGEGQAFHGYWTQDFDSLNPHFGQPGDLNNLSDALHKRGMYLMLDVVVNHMAATTLPPAFANFTPFNNAIDFHPQCFVSDYNNQTDVEQCWLGDTTVALADINTENQTVVDTLNSWVKNIVSTTGADGVRIDTLKHVRKDFWPAFASAAGVFTIGEVLINDTSYAAPYTEVIDSVLDYPTYFNLISAFATPQGNLGALVDIYQLAQTKYKTGAFNTGSFLENHDQPRFQSMTSDQSLVKNAITWTFATDGIPILYYGQEQGYNGGNDPNNREALWFSGYQTEGKPLVSHVTTLNKARKAASTASSSFYKTPTKFINTTATTLAFSKPPFLTLLTNVGNSTSATWTVNGQDAGYSNNEKLVDVLSCNTVQVDGSGKLQVTSSNGLPQVLLPTNMLGSSGLCSNVKSDAVSLVAAIGTWKAVGILGALLAGTIL